MNLDLTRARVFLLNDVGEARWTPAQTHAPVAAGGPFGLSARCCCSS
jgi:hypothetical protein